MRTLFFAIITTGAALAVPAHAQEAAQQPSQVASPDTPEPASGFDLTAGVTATTDYRFRGLSQSNKRPAIQGTIGVTHASGFYVGTWASTISNYVASGSPAEVDLYAGYKKTTAGGTTFDAGLLYYWYPDSDGVNTDFFEPYANVLHAFGAVTAKVGTNFGWKQHALGLAGERRSAFYGYGELSGTIPLTPVSLTAHLGHSFRRDYITFGTHYTDWSLTAAYVVGPATFSVGYVDTNRALFSYPAGGGKNRNIAKGGVVGSVAFAF